MLGQYGNLVTLTLTLSLGSLLKRRQLKSFLANSSQSCDVEFAHVNSASDFPRIFILHEKIHATRV